jgi:hypothetical protein
MKIIVNENISLLIIDNVFCKYIILELNLNALRNLIVPKNVRDPNIITSI